MVDPHNVTDYARTSHQLEEFAVFCVIVAGKNAGAASRALEGLLTRLRAQPNYEDFCPTGLLLSLGSEAALAGLLRVNGVGCYNAKAHYLWVLCEEIAEGRLDLRSCTVEQLEELPGWGPKTARYFVLHTRPGVRIAALDTHMLAHLRSKGFNAPRSSPPAGGRYRELEQTWLALADEAGMTPAEFDLKIWRERTRTKPVYGEE